MPSWRPFCQFLILIFAVVGSGLSAFGSASTTAKAKVEKSAPEGSPSVESSVLSFKEWKSKKVSAAIDELVRLRRSAAGKGQLDQGPEAVSETEGPKESAGSNRIQSLKAEPISEALKAQLNQAKINLDVVRELSVTDYFALYLTQQKDRKDAFSQAARKLDDSELAEILLAYDKHLRQSESRVAGP